MVVGSATVMAIQASTDNCVVDGTGEYGRHSNEAIEISESCAFYYMQPERFTHRIQLPLPLNANVRCPRLPLVHHNGRCVCSCENTPLSLLNGATLLFAQACPHICPTSSPELLRILPPNLGGLYVRRTLIIWTAQHTDDAHEDCFGGLDRRPTLRRMLVAIRIVRGGMQDRDTDFAGGVDWDDERIGQLGEKDSGGGEDENSGGAHGCRLTVRVEQGRYKGHLWWQMWILLRERQMGSVVAA